MKKTSACVDCGHAWDPEIVIDLKAFIKFFFKKDINLSDDSSRDSFLKFYNKNDIRSGLQFDIYEPMEKMESLLENRKSLLNKRNNIQNKTFDDTGTPRIEAMKSFFVWLVILGGFMIADDSVKLAIMDNTVLYFLYRVAVIIALFAVIYYIKHMIYGTSAGASAKNTALKDVNYDVEALQKECDKLQKKYHKKYSYLA